MALSENTLRRFVPAAAIACVFVLVAVLYLCGAPGAYQTVLGAWGFDPYTFPFLDTHGVLAAIQCDRLGMDVFTTNPCDVLDRPHPYSPLFLWLSFLPITTDSTAAAGLCLCILFIASLTLLPAGRTRGEVAVMTLAAVSTTTVYALERANMDLLLFALTLAACLLLPRAWAARWLGYAAILLAAALKFYPAAALVLALRERARACLAVAAVSAVVLLAFAWREAQGLREVLDVIPRGSYFDQMFGSRNLPYGVAWELRLGAPVPRILQAALVVAMLALGWRIAAREATLAALARLSTEERLVLLAASLVLVGCFLAGESAVYRGVYLLLLLPGLIALRRVARGRPMGGVFLAGCVLTLALLWSNFFRAHLDNVLLAAGVPADARWIAGRGVWLARELAWWALATLMTGFAITLVLQSDAVRTLLRRRVVIPGG